MCTGKSHLFFGFGYGLDFLLDVSVEGASGRIEWAFMLHRQNVHKDLCWKRYNNIFYGRNIVVCMRHVKVREISGSKPFLSLSPAHTHTLALGQTLYVCVEHTVQQLGNTFGDYRNMELMPYKKSKSMEKALQSWCIIFAAENLILTKKKTNSDYICDLVTDGIILFPQSFSFFSRFTHRETVNYLQRKVLVQCRLRINLIDCTSYILINYHWRICCYTHLGCSQPSSFAPLWHFFPFRLTFSRRRLFFLVFIPDFHFSPVCLSNGDLQVKYSAFFV